MVAPLRAWSAQTSNSAGEWATVAGQARLLGVWLILEVDADEEGHGAGTRRGGGSAATDAAGARAPRLRARALKRALTGRGIARDAAIGGLVLQHGPDELLTEYQPCGLVAASVNLPTATGPYSMARFSLGAFVASSPG